MMAVAEVVPILAATYGKLKNGLVKAVDRVLARGPADAVTAARVEQTLEAVQAGSYCTSSPAPGSPAKPDLRDLLQANLRPRPGG
jgi:hypothetical protein